MHKNENNRLGPEVAATVHIVDDDMGVREALRRVLRRAGYTVETHAGAAPFLEAYDGQPGCLILDLAMPKMRGEVLLGEIVERNLNLVVLVLTGHATIRSAVRVTQLGAVDVLEKPVDHDLLLTKLREMREVGRKAFARRALAEDFHCRFDSLTHREKQVIELLLAGLTSLEIGQRLGNSKKTIDIHRGRIMQKMGAASVTELIMEWTSLSGEGF
ncbi:response regulator [Marinobacter alexandrii]|uniref:response regulator transcription factor n=1 Tax=Marinobacter alexandrii TaxID=2570351 RepID=UPI001FFE2E4B|nr:response regulator [Marinobacter alexandrii]MCK2149275.1 response regulator [Marinobacter alexandrii]